MFVKNCILFFCLTLAVPCAGYGQTHLDTLCVNHWFVAAETHLFSNRNQTLFYCDSIESIAARTHQVNWQLRSLALRVESANIFAVMELLELHLRQMDSCLKRHQPVLGEDYWPYQEHNQLYWGVFFQKKGDLGQSQSFFIALQQQIEQRPGSIKEKSSALFAILQYIAKNYIDAGDHGKALECYMQSLLHLRKYSKSSIGYVNALYNIGDIYYEQRQPEQALSYYHQALDSLNKAIQQNGSNKWYAYSMNLHRRLGLFYVKEGQSYKAFEHFEQALASSQPESPFYAYILENMGAAYGKIQDPNKAMLYYNQALHLKEALYGRQSMEMAETYLQIGVMYHDLNNPTQATIWYQKALEMKDGLLQKDGSIPITISFGSQLFRLKALSAYLPLAYVTYKQNPSDTAQLNQIWASVQYAFRVVEQARASLHNNKDKQTLLDCYRSIFELGIQCALRFTSQGDSLARGVGAEAFPFYAAEKSKSLLLYEGTQETIALNYSEIPKALLKQEHHFQVEIAYNDKSRFALEGQGRSVLDSGMIELYEKKIALEQAYKKFQNDLETSYPAYFRLKYDFQTEDIGSIQRTLIDADQALVEYFVGDSSIFIFCIKKSGCQIVEVNRDFPLETWVKQLRAGLSDFFVNPDKSNEYDRLSAQFTTAAYQLYQKLIAPIAAQLPTKIIIIPDGMLGYIPFEVLLAEPPDDPIRWSQHHYLQNDHTISYCYSATMLREMKHRQFQPPPALPFLGFAPQYAGDTLWIASALHASNDVRKHFQPLPFSGEEVLRAAQILNGQAWVGNNATKENFLEMASQARILHLATHAQSNDKMGDYCFFVFTKKSAQTTQGEPDNKFFEFLYARDIYNLSLHADLVTLSACETGIGELQNSEGIISLARAFAYAGAKSIVTSLWSVSDAKTKDLMVDFYQNLHAGMQKDVALRAAKLAALKRNKGVAAHPFYWAGFVGIGGMEPLD